MSIDPVKFIPIKPIDTDDGGVDGIGGKGALGAGLPNFSGKAGAFATMLQSVLRSGGTEALDLTAQMSLGNQFMTLMQGNDAAKLSETGDMNQLMDMLTRTGDGKAGGMDFMKLMGGVGGNTRSLDLIGLVGSAIPQGLSGVDMDKLAEALQTASKVEPSGANGSAGDGPGSPMNGLVPEADELQGLEDVDAADAPASMGSAEAVEAPVSRQAAPAPSRPATAALGRTAGVALQAMLGTGSGQASPALNAARNAMARKAYGAGGATDPFGMLSARFESGGDPGSVGFDRVGGTSYGIYQIASRTGTFDHFLSFLDRKAPDMAVRLRAAGEADTGSRSGPMPSAWRTLAHEQPKRFSGLQHEFIRETHFNPALKKVADLTGVDLTGRHQAVAQVLWSTAVQHGATGSARIFARALEAVRSSMDGPGFEKDLIKAVYENRSRQFGSSTERVRGAVNDRFRNELREVLSLLDGSSILDSNA